MEIIVTGVEMLWELLLCRGSTRKNHPLCHAERASAAFAEASRSTPIIRKL
jgi:hypothetical protein